MPTYRTIYPKKFIDGQMLAGHKPQPVTIEAVTIEEFFNPFTKGKINKIVLRFYKKTARLPLNQTQAEAVATIAKTDDFEQWIGHSVRLTAGTAPNRKPTVAILPPLAETAPAEQPHPDPDPDLELDPDASEEDIEEGIGDDAAVAAADIDALFNDLESK